MSIYRWAKLDDQSGPDRSIELTSISGWAGKKPSQEGLVFGSVARLPLVGPEHQWVGRQKNIPGRGGVWEGGAPSLWLRRASVGRPAKNHPRKGWCSGVWRASRWSAPSISGWAGKKTIPGRVGVWECGAPPVGRPRASVGRPAETQSNLEHTHRKENTRAEHTGREQQHFRLIDHWKRESVSGSLCIGIKFRFQAHSTIGKCSERGKAAQTQHRALLSHLHRLNSSAPVFCLNGMLRGGCECAESG